MPVTSDHARLEIRILAIRAISFSSLNVYAIQHRDLWRHFRLDLWTFFEPISLFTDINFTQVRVINAEVHLTLISLVNLVRCTQKIESAYRVALIGGECEKFVFV